MFGADVVVFEVPRLLHDEFENLLRLGREGKARRQGDAVAGGRVSLAGMTDKMTTTVEEDHEERTTIRTRTTPTSKVLGLALEATIKQNELVIIDYR